jgi:hypothetical protein
MRSFLLLLAVCAPAEAQTTESTLLSVDRATSLVADYARGMTEVRFDAACRITRTDHGKAPATHKTRLTFEFVKGRYRGTDPDKESSWDVTWHVTQNWSRRALGFELYTDGLFAEPVSVFDPAERKKWAFEPGPGKISFRSADSCPTFHPQGKNQFGLTLCGAGDISEATANSPMRLHYEATGLPVTSGNDTLSAYRADGEFVAVHLPGGSRPFLFPKHASAAYTFGSGDITLDCTYAMREKKR